MVDYKAQGKRNKASGADFERRVRKDLESDGWIVSKWQNNVDFDEAHIGKCVPAKPGRFRMMQTGFPDFVAYKRMGDLYEIYFIESKSNGYLTHEEKKKAVWYLDNSYCSNFLVAKKIKIKNRVHIEYTPFTLL